jgi:2'-5' RNA ligase/MFS family permease
LSTGNGAHSAPAPDDEPINHPTTSGPGEAGEPAHPAEDREPARAEKPGTRPAPHPQSAPHAQSAQHAESAQSAQPGGPGRPTSGKTSMFSSLRVRNYRLFAMGQAVSNTGTWMQRIAQDWLVLSLTGSSTAVGITTALQFLPMLLFGLYGGVIADRCDKRKLLLCTQSVMGITALALATLTLSGHVRVTHVYVLAFVLGLATVLDNPTRQTFVSEMVGPAQIRNAVSLNSANFQSARLVGPAVSGVMISAVGSGWAFLFNGLSFIAPLTGLLMMRTRELHKSERAPRSKGQLREGLRYVRGNPGLMWSIILVGFVGTFGYNFPIWLSAFTSKVFREGAGTYGLLNTLMAVGSVAGALLAARRGTSRMRLMVGAATLFGVLETVAALSPSFWLFAALMTPIGIMGLTFNVTANSGVQLAADSAMRGRVMSLYMMVFVGGTPIGGPIMGWVTDHFGARTSFLLGGLISAAIALLVGLALARASGLRLRVGRGKVRFVPREVEADVAAVTSQDGGATTRATAGAHPPSAPVQAPARVQAPVQAPARAQAQAPARVRTRARARTQVQTRARGPVPVPVAAGWPPSADRRRHAGGMRLFAALLPPEYVLDELARAAQGLRALPGAQALRWTERANWHITIAFYGEVPDGPLPALRERLARAAARRGPMDLRVAGGGRFGQRALWAGIVPSGGRPAEHPEPGAGAHSATRPGPRPQQGTGSQPQQGPGPQPRTSRDLRLLALSAAAAGRKAGLDTEEPRHFRAHLTLAHVRGRGAGRDAGNRPVDLRPYADALDSFAGRPWTAAELVLVRSNLPAGGVPGEQPRYERLAAWPLGR